jgi:hypothetical protein
MSSLAETLIEMGGKRIEKSVGQYFSMNASSREMLLSQY